MIKEKELTGISFAVVTFCPVLWNLAKDVFAIIFVTTNAEKVEQIFRRAFSEEDKSILNEAFELAKADINKEVRSVRIHRMQQ